MKKKNIFTTTGLRAVTGKQEPLMKHTISYFDVDLPVYFSRISKILVFLWALLTWTATAHAGHIQVFLLGGQSNMVGQGMPIDLPTLLQGPHADILFYSNLTNSLVSLQPGNKFGPEITFGRDMADADPAQSFGLVKHAKGGTSLVTDWKPDIDDNVYADFRTTVANGLAAMLNAGHTTEIVGMLWTQGERDARLGQTTSQYETNLNAFIADIRSNYGPALPFYISQLSILQTNISADQLAAIRQAQANVADDDPNAYLIDTDSFGMKTDNLHFNSDGQISLGSAFAGSATAIRTPTTKVKVSWNKNEFEISGERPYSTKPDINTVYNGLADVRIADIEVLDTEMVYAFTLGGTYDDEWKYKDKKHRNGNLAEYKVEWKPDGFDWENSDTYGKLHLHTHSIGDNRTTFCIHSEEENLPMTVSIDGALIEYDSAGEINTALDYEVQKNKDSHVHFELDFELDAETEIVVTLEDPVPDLEIIAGDFYKEAHLKFRVKGIFQDIALGDAPETVAYELTFRDEDDSVIFSFDETIGDYEDWDIFNHKKWEYTKGSED
jgi:hypothetical protein